MWGAESREINHRNNEVTLQREHHTAALSQAARAQHASEPRSNLQTEQPRLSKGSWKDFLWARGPALTARGSLITSEDVGNKLFTARSHYITQRVSGLGAIHPVLRANTATVTVS